MGESFQKTLSFISALGVVVIAIQLIPFSRDKELSNHCREYYAITKKAKPPITINLMGSRLASKVKLIKRKTGLIRNQEVYDYCHSFYLNQKP